MFRNCYGSGFLVNGVFKFPVSGTFGAYAFSYTLNLGTPSFSGSARTQTRTATSIINGRATPASAMNTFGPSSTVWTDYSSLPANWR
jgi:hypothetical protein